jgi:hypothetical protein
LVGGVLGAGLDLERGLLLVMTGSLVLALDMMALPDLTVWVIGMVVRGVALGLLALGWKKGQVLECGWNP